MADYEESAYDTAMDGLGTFTGTIVSTYIAAPEYQDLINEGIAQYANNPEEFAGIVAGVGALGFGRRTLENGKETVDNIREYLDG